MFPIFKLFVCFVIQCEPIRKNVLGKCEKINDLQICVHLGDSTNLVY